MIPAKISNLNPVQVTYYLHKIIYQDTGEDEWIPIIADVENVRQGVITKRWYAEIRIYFEGDNLSYIEPKKIELNQEVFIEETSPGKCRIVKL